MPYRINPATRLHSRSDILFISNLQKESKTGIKTGFAGFRRVVTQRPQKHWKAGNRTVLRGGKAKISISMDPVKKKSYIWSIMTGFRFWMFRSCWSSLSLSYWRSGQDCMPGGVPCKIRGKAQFPFNGDSKRRLKIKKLALKP